MQLLYAVFMEQQLCLKIEEKTLQQAADVCDWCKEEECTDDCWYVAHSEDICYECSRRGYRARYYGELGRKVLELVPLEPSQWGVYCEQCEKGL